MLLCSALCHKQGRNHQAASILPSSPASSRPSVLSSPSSHSGQTHSTRCLGVFCSCSRRAQPLSATHSQLRLVDNGHLYRRRRRTIDRHTRTCQQHLVSCWQRLSVRPATSDQRPTAYIRTTAYDRSGHSVLYSTATAPSRSSCDPDKSPTSPTFLFPPRCLPLRRRNKRCYLHSSSTLPGPRNVRRLGYVR